jgi:RimJ/RimL family protein N-acetyltransferase
MSAGPELRSERLVLRRWREGDLEAFAALNADARVMRHMPKVLSRAESDALVAGFEAHFEAHGFGRWAVEVPGVAACVGFVGLAVPGFEAPFTPCVEASWRLAAEHWGRGYASEAARRALRFAAEELGLAEAVAYTVPANLPSLRVMERVGMARDAAGDFDHPSLPEGSPLRRHVLYRWRPGH